MWVEQAALQQVNDANRGASHNGVWTNVWLYTAHDIVTGYNERCGLGDF